LPGATTVLPGDPIGPVVGGDSNRPTVAFVSHIGGPALTSPPGVSAKHDAALITHDALSSAPEQARSRSSPGAT